MEENKSEVLEIFGDGMSADKAKNTKGTVIRLIRYMKKQRTKLITVFLMSIISSGLMIATPMVMGEAVNILFDGINKSLSLGTKFQVNIETMGGIIGLLLLIYLLGALFKYFEQFLMAGVAQSITLTMREDYSQKLNRLPIKYFDMNKKGEILSRATNDLEKVADSLQDGLMQLITSIVTVIGAIIMMLFISPTLTLVAAITLAISFFVTNKIAKKSQLYYSDNQKCVGELNSNIEEMFTGHVVVKAFGKEESTVQNFKEVNEKLYNAGRKAQFASYAISPAIRFINQMGYVVIAVVGGVYAANGKMSLGSIQAFIQYVVQSSEPMTEASYIVNMLQSAIASAERFFQVMDVEEEVYNDKTETIKNPKGCVEFQHVKFGYSDENILMKDINLKLNSGDKIAIVGPTGAGKTTLVNLLMRFYEIQEGNIIVDGVDIKKMSRKDLRTMFGMVLQDTWLFNGSIYDNIAYSCENTNLEEVTKAAKAARADHFIRTMPHGYNTELNEDASNISQGQKQLLTIARVILADPSILILDEATSSVDTRTEIEIQKAMNSLMKGRTSFVIAHRLSTIRDADLILVMNEGNIVEQGNHDKLIEKKGFYFELYNSQFVAN